MEECKLYHKTLEGIPLTDVEVKLLGDIIREELKFLVRNNILPTPKNYEKWFVVFCIAYEMLGELPSDEKLLELYNSVHRVDKLSDIRFDVGVSLEALSKIAKDFHNMIREHKEYVHSKEQELSSMEVDISGDNLSRVLLELLKSVKEIRYQNEKYIRKIEEQQRIIKELKDKIEQVENEANIDHLTQAYNRRSFERALRDSFEEFKNGSMPFCLVLIDLDGFKPINDNYGHNIGDLVLRKVAQTLRQGLRARDVLARWGGDEFAIIMPNTQKTQALRVAERLKKTIEDLDIIIEGERLTLSFSYGVVEVSEKYKDVGEMIEEADRLMYEQKRSRKVGKV
ncbi:MAG: GGDEF domain-containing protein [Aquificaceae bacterium]|nr:GGDEF domain-containing protein [Aquificaceae bacterium]MDW8433187.1 GGDEF domain-containing protein [Aquificaceae bacterium]